MRSNLEWILWGRRDPLFGVASWPGRERGSPQAWTDDDFYEQGRSDWAGFLARWVTYGLDPASCVEIGSGAGRLTKHMVDSFGQLYAVDVSAEMLEYAKQHIPAGNVTYVVTDGQHLPLASRSVTAAFSTHVFQHFDSFDDAAGYFAELARVLTPKGSLMIHLPLHVFPAARTTMRLLYAARKRAGDLRSTVLRLAAARGLTRPPMRGLSYELHEILDTLRVLGFTDVEFSFFALSADDGLQPFVFARRG